MELDGGTFYNSAYLEKDWDAVFHLHILLRPPLITQLQFSLASETESQVFSMV